MNPRASYQRLIDHVAVARNAVDAMSSFVGLMAVAELWLDERYPADMPLVCDPDSPDLVAPSLADWFGAGEIPDCCEVCGNGAVVGVRDGSEVLGVCRDCLGSAPMEKQR